MQIFENVESKLFNVVIVSEYPYIGGYARHSEVCNAEPLSFHGASKWVHGIMTGIGRDWKTPSRYVDIYMELAHCPRPFTEEIQSMLSQEELRRNAETDYEVAYAGIIAQQEVAHSRAMADVELMTADLNLPNRMKFYQGDAPC
jgi:hypothetical protein